jgi:hypothetical protein
MGAGHKSCQSPTEKENGITKSMGMEPVNQAAVSAKAGFNGRRA